MNILITGGAGFIGSHLCDRLIKNNKIICVDNLFTGNKNNIKHLINNDNFRFIKHDIIEPLFLDRLSYHQSLTGGKTNLEESSSRQGKTDLEEMRGNEHFDKRRKPFDNEKIDQIYNLACPASPVHYQFNAIRTIKANILGTINMLGLAKKHKARILQASTSEVYGNPLEHPQKESYFGNVNFTGIRSCYDEGKRCAETLMFDYHRQNKIDIKVVRIFNTYGERMARDDGRVVSNFITQALEGKDITVYGDGSQTRSFCYVSDMVEGMVKMMNCKGFIGPVNLGNPKEFTILELAKKVIELTSSKSKIVFKKLPEDDPKQRQPDISLAKEKIGWEPKVELDDGLGDTIRSFRKVP